MTNGTESKDERPDSKTSGTTEGEGFVVHDPTPGGDGAARLPVDFSTFVISLAASAVHHLGLVEGGEDETAEKNLPLARQTIDTLEMLERKTRGNLEDEEGKLLQTILYELRMGFVKAKG